MQFVRVRKTPVGEPEFLIETLGVYNECVTLPLGNSASVVERIIRVAAQLPNLLAAIEVDQPPIVVDATDKHENPLMIFILNELDAVGFLELPRSAGRQAIKVLRVIGKSIPLAQFK
jgi:hypothetical protein